MCLDDKITHNIIMKSKKHTLYQKYCYTGIELHDCKGKE